MYLLIAQSYIKTKVRVTRTSQKTGGNTQSQLSMRNTYRCLYYFLCIFLYDDRQRLLRILFYANRGVQHYLIKFVSNLRQVGGILRVLRFPPSIKLTIRK